MKTGFLKTLYYALTAALLVSTTSVWADLNLADGGASGSFFNPEREGEGIWVEVSETGGGDVVFALAFYTYDSEGSQLWLTGAAVVEDGATTLSVPVIQVEGPTWGAGYDPGDQQITPFGTISVRYPNCDSVLFSIQTDVELEDQNLSMIRLTYPIGVSCTNQPTDRPALTPGKWEGDGTCVFVAPDGKSITDVGSTCPDGNSPAAFWLDQQGIEVDLGNNEIGVCVADVKCEGTWPIDEDGIATCTSPLGSIGQIKFDTSQASVEGVQGLIGPGSTCLAGSTAVPPQ